tara:strand:+ start:7172 stop:8482 length:1311 start_codon:yes stop_codon:yes gene_type:complete
MKNLTATKIRLETLIVFPLLISFFYQREIIFLPIYFLTAIVFFFLVVFDKKKSSSSNRIFTYLLAYLILSPLPRLLLDTFNFESYVLYFFTGGVFFISIVGMEKFRINELELIVKSIRFFTFLQVPLILFQAYSNGFSKGDWCKGIFENAHIAGFFIYLFITYDAFGEFTLKNNKKIAVKLFLRLFIFLIAGYFTDSNTFMGSFALSAVVIFLIKNVKFKIFSVVLGSAFILYFSSGYYQFVNRDPLEIPKIKGYATISSVFKEDPFNIIFGTGVGQYSSRASVVLAPSYMVAKPQGNIFNITSYSGIFEKYLANLYAPSYYDALTKMGTTGTYYTPFSTGLSIITEYGLFGIFILIVAVYRHIQITKKDYRKYAIFLWGAFFIMCLYDNWLEYPFITFTLSVIFVFLQKKEELAHFQDKKILSSCQLHNHHSIVT